MLQDRSANGSPKVSITFPDGSHDMLVLNQAGQGSCNWLGHLQNELDACVALTGCPGQEDLDLTILSDHLTQSSLLKWYKNGQVEYVEPMDKNFHETIDENEAFEELINEERSDDDIKMPESHLMKVKVVYDQHVKDDAKGEDVNQMHKVMTHVQAMFCHKKSLGTKIQLQYDLKLAQGEYWSLGSNGNAGKGTRDFVKNNPDFFKGSDMNVFVGNPYGGGVACFGCMCRSGDPGKAINSWHGKDFGYTANVRTCLLSFESPCKTVFVDHCS